MANILIIEDDAALVDDLCFFIEDAGHKCTAFRYADEVIDALNSIGQFKYIILDIMMMKGTKITEDDLSLETGEIIYKIIRDKYPKINIIVLSAKNFSEMEIDFAKEPNVKIIQKPFGEASLNKLLSILR